MGIRSASRIGTRLRGKLQGAQTLLMMARYLENWRETWSAYRSSATLPSLRFREGFVLGHGEGDNPVLLLREVFSEESYDWRIRVPARGTAIDLGANIGTVSLRWAARSPGLQVHAYEPAPRTFDMLRENVRENALDSRVKVYPEAVGRECGELQMWTNLPSVLNTAYAEERPLPDAIQVRVPMIDLNEVVRRVAGPVEILKIDTEGAEADILEGAEDRTLRQVRQVALEYHEYLCPDALQRCSSRLERAGFRTTARPAGPQQGMLYASANSR